MSVNQLVNMITRMFVRKAVNHGVKAGVNAFSSDNAGRGKPRQNKKGGGPQMDTKRARQAMRAARRISKF